MIKNFQTTSERLVKFVLSSSPTRVIILGYLCLLLLGTILLSLPISTKSGTATPLLDALFTATSAICVTGLVVVDTFTHWSLFGQLVILGLIQIGGIGFMTIATLISLLIRRKISIRERMLIAESLNVDGFKGIVKMTKKILIGTFIIETIGAVFLSIRFVQDFGFWGGIYRGIFHSITAFCNAGFDILGHAIPFNSLSAYRGDLIVNVTIMALIILGGIGFLVWDDVYFYRKRKTISLHSKLVLSITVFLLVSGFLSFFLLEFSNPKTIGSLSFGEKVLASLFHSVSTRTAGYNTIDLTQLTPTSTLLTIILMFIGGAPASTAGGIKVITFGLLVLGAFSALRNVPEIEVFQRRISPKALFKALAITTFSILIVLGCVVVLSIKEDNTRFLSLVFEAVSAFATVGLTQGLTPSLHPISRMAVIFTMFLGKVGIITFALSLTMKSKSLKKHYKYPETKVIVG